MRSSVDRVQMSSLISHQVKAILRTEYRRAWRKKPVIRKNHRHSVWLKIRRRSLWSHRTACSAIVDPILLNQEVAVTELYIGLRPVRSRVNLTEGSRALVCVFQGVPVKPPAAHRVGDYSIQHVGHRRSHSVRAKVSVRCRQTGAITSKKLRRTDRWTANGV